MIGVQSTDLKYLNDNSFKNYVQIWCRLKKVLKTIKRYVKNIVELSYPQSDIVNFSCWRITYRS